MLNPFFLQGSQGEQGLVQDLINEQLRMYGLECHYIPRKLVTSRTIMKEVTESRFDQAFPLETYLMNKHLTICNAARYIYLFVCPECFHFLAKLLG